MQSELSVVIPFAFKEISKPFISDVFELKLKCGTIQKIDIVNTKSSQYNKVFIHFKHWCNDSVIDRKDIEEGKEVVVMYSLPWFWIVKKLSRRT